MGGMPAGRGRQQLLQLAMGRTVSSYQANLDGSFSVGGAAAAGTAQRRLRRKLCAGTPGDFYDMHGNPVGMVSGLCMARPRAAMSSIQRSRQPARPTCLREAASPARPGLPVRQA